MANQSSASSSGAGLLSMYDEVIVVVGEGGRVVGGASRGVGKAWGWGSGVYFKRIDLRTVVLVLTVKA